MTAAIILAAGESSRLGFPKQTLLYKGKTLLELAIEAGLKSKCSPVIVVLGAKSANIEPGIKAYDIIILNNQDWSEGMASSIRMAVKHINQIQDIESAVFLLCDQPFVNSRLIDSLIYKQQETSKPIVGCAYKNTVGVPVLFKRQLFTELLSLEGQEGAKKVLNNYSDQIAVISFEKGGIDIDTLADYEDLLKNS